MRIIHLFWVVLLAGAVMLPSSTAAAQELTLADASELWIEGTSNRSDWTVYAREMTATAAGVEELAPSRLELTVNAPAIEGDKSTIMDRLMYEALQVQEHPTISYELTSVESSDGDGVLSTTGLLTLAGTTNEITMDVQAERLDDGTVRYTGSLPLTMSDYGIRPPTAMFGALRTADDVTVHFDVTFSPSG